jgi:GNAT superfamily N-acetyltransferase
MGERYFSDLELSRRLERTEGLSNASFVSRRAALAPALGATSTEIGGAFVMYDGPGSPVTQTFCLGLFEPATDAVLDSIAAFYSARGVPADCEVSPLVGVELYNRLGARGYRPIELSAVLFRELDSASSAALLLADRDRPTARVMTAGEGVKWSETNAAGWLDAAPDFTEFLLGISQVNASRADTTCFFAEINGEPVAAGALSIHDGVALLAGASTRPEARGRGAQQALLEARLSFAREAGCDLALMGALPGSRSQRNAERHGFRIAYTRTKWRLNAQEE